MTEVFSNGYYTIDDDVCQIALESFIGDYATSSKIIVLTEGSTDTEILKKSLRLLYPHLYDYYTFMDFGVKPPGGVGHLINAVKSFAGAGIENRVIALFDNDTAAYSAVGNLSKLKLSNNIKNTHYPDIELAESYPTNGPNGISNQNINKLACSIELYLGRDVLENNGELIPIQWKGHDEKTGKYQGKILNKTDIQKQFRKKIDLCTENNNEINNCDWSELHQIFKHIFSLFSDLETTKDL